MDSQYITWITLALTVIVAFAWWRTRPATAASVVDIVGDQRTRMRNVGCGGGATRQHWQPADER